MKTLTLSLMMFLTLSLPLEAAQLSERTHYYLSKIEKLEVPYRRFKHKINSIRQSEQLLRLGMTEGQRNYPPIYANHLGILQKLGSPRLFVLFIRDLENSYDIIEQRILDIEKKREKINVDLHNLRENEEENFQEIYRLTDLRFDLGLEKLGKNNEKKELKILFDGLDFKIKDCFKFAAQALYAQRKRPEVTFRNLNLLNSYCPLFFI
jgi:prefoldin subunit 5